MRSAAEWSTSAMIAVEPVRRNATVLAAPITKSTNSATATARVLVVIRPLYYPRLALDGRKSGCRTGRLSVSLRNVCAQCPQSAQDALRATEMWRKHAHFAGPVSCMDSW